MLGLSKGVTTIYRYPTRPAAGGLAPGSMIWDEGTGQLLVSNGTAWILVGPRP